MQDKIILKEDVEEKIKYVIKNTDFNFCFEYISNNIADTYFLATCFAKHLRVGNVVNINGELGAGKTAFVTGIAKFLGIEAQVSSPTFTIVNEYNLKDEKKLFHFDVYRLANSDEFLEGVGSDYFENGICIIEWGNIIFDILPDTTINIDISKDMMDENKRIFKIWR